MIKEGRPEAPSNYIRVHGDKYRQAFRVISSKNEIFSQDIHWEVDEDKIIFTIATIDNISKNIKKFCKKKVEQNWYQASFSDDRIPLGHFMIDEDESNEDRIVVYFEDERERV